ncbi:GNAT family N-acetyltransferase [Saccharopolyspora rhizosphaerae]|uniref:GNAT family N-acetyltransferase n=1 Tax=Saccharopolyspora rhizosphaerae TaxID=2492662 RepID=A0A426JPB6_9PSEU|nr:GNAT family N-acetyltransferase [Saccharopolyspora rhizosphaerae]RRO15082.1 GNAT family N-acetyltransferase [Saccharopolyspora rhizosphaerae]
MIDDAALPDPPLPDLVLSAFTEDDLAELVVLQRCCWVPEALINESLDVPALHESPAQVLEWATSWTTLVVRRAGRFVGAVRGRREGSTWQVGRLMVAPDLAGQGIGSWLLDCVERVAPPDIGQFVLFTGAKSTRNIATYERAGYRLAELPDPLPPGHIAGAVHMTKPRPQVA